MTEVELCKFTKTIYAKYKKTKTVYTEYKL